MESFGKILTKLRKAKGLSQIDVATKMTEAGFVTLNQSVSRWEKDINVPNALQFLELMRIFEVSDVRGAFGHVDVEFPLSQLSEENRNKVLDYISNLVDAQKYRNGEVKESNSADANVSRIKGKQRKVRVNKPRIHSVPADKLPDAESFKNEKSNVIIIETEKIGNVRRLPFYDLAVSAGPGNYMDSESDSSNMIDVPEKIPASADFAVRISGNSMQPKFKNGDLVWVHSQAYIESGEFGIFNYDGDALCKQFVSENGKSALVSVNPEYAPKPLNDEHDFKVFGKIVGTSPVTSDMDI